MKYFKPVIAVIAAASICAAAAISGNCNAQVSDEDLRVLEGTVADVNIGKSILTVVFGGIRIAFPISSDTRLVKDINDIKLSDFGIGDRVMVEYYRAGDESRVPLKVVRVTLTYDVSEQPSPAAEKVISYQ